MSNEILIRCCAPTMACLKTGNMFNCAFSGPEQMTEELRRLNLRLTAVSVPSRDAGEGSAGSPGSKAPVGMRIHPRKHECLPGAADRPPADRDGLSP